MAVQAPTHVLSLLRFSNFHVAQLAMTGLAVHSGRDVRAMIEENKVWLDKDRHPWDRRIGGHIIGNFLLLLVFDWDLLMASPTFGAGGQSGRSCSPRAWMAVQALNAKPQVHLMVECYGLGWRLLGCPNPIGCSSQQEHQYQTKYDEEDRFFYDLYDLCG